MIKRLEPRLTGAVLVEGTAPIAPDDVTRQAEASIYCPDYQFTDEALVHRCHAGGVRLVPWTVNQPEDWQRLIGWSVDGITTDYPDRLAEWLRDRNIAF